jgi:hypothetical protein
MKRSKIGGSEPDLYTVLLGVAALLLAVGVVWVAFANIAQTRTGSGTGSMLGLVSPR